LKIQFVFIRYGTNALINVLGVRCVAHEIGTYPTIIVDGLWNSSASIEVIKDEMDSKVCKLQTPGLIKDVEQDMGAFPKYRPEKTLPVSIRIMEVTL